ncbi:uncharacterized protein si:ch211-227n13.3 [Hippocampus zosterae]|uniref:uncharacterized protein si:ch211-227n13.3 n=1 Tax=Hippocampus zosterae TaxID=109293 RepID=UPI00223CDCE5|nr:uncharacterized protein si:ch211-227n13.3 [Hippocampus zosterae]
MLTPAMEAPTQAGREPSEIKTPGSTEYESDCFESSNKSKQLEVFLHSSFVYNLNWRVTMKTRHSSRLKTTANRKQEKNPNLSEDVIQRRVRPKRRRRRMGFDVGDINNENESKDVIKSHVEEEPEEGRSVQVVDRGLDDSDDQCCFSTPPPPLMVKAPNKKRRPPSGLCPSCRKLYQRAKRLKTPIKDKLLDNDPTSLTCDHWVLLKKWKPSRLPHSGKLSRSVLLVHKRLKGKKKAKDDEHQNLCSRLHVFLRRNLRRPPKVLAKKERNSGQRKRARDDSQDPQIVKQKHLRGNSLLQDDSGYCHERNSSDWTRAGLDVDGCSGVESSNENNSNVTANIPCTFTSETTEAGAALPPKPKAPRNKMAFQDLLAQLRGNSSMIFKETQ